MLKQRISVPNIKWFEFVTGVTEPEFIKRRAECIQLLCDHSSNVLHGVNLGPSLQIRYVGILFCELVIATGDF
jgi:hypothetical protein